MKDKCEACRKTWPDYGAATNALGCDLNPLCKANPQKCGLRDKRPNGCQWAKENASTKTCQGNMIDSIALAVGHEFKETLLEKVKTLVRSYDAARAELDTLWAERTCENCAEYRASNLFCIGFGKPNPPYKTPKYDGPCNRWSSISNRYDR